VKPRVEKKVQREVYIIISVKKTVQKARFGQERFIQGKQDIMRYWKREFLTLYGRQ
jgi:hypothetical protein